MKEVYKVEVITPKDNSLYIRNYTDTVINILMNRMPQGYIDILIKKINDIQKTDSII